MESIANSAGLSSPCSCDDCDTIRCLTGKRGMCNDENDGGVTCIFFTNVTVEKTNSDKNTAISVTTPLKIQKLQETECELCRKFIKNEHNLDTVSELMNTSKSLCESCIRNINKIKQSTNTDLVINDAKSNVDQDTTELELEFEVCKPKENDIRNLKFEIYGKDPGETQESKKIRKSKCKICIRGFQTHENVGDLKTDTTPFEKMTSFKRLPNKPCSHKHCKKCLSPNQDKDCKKGFETRALAQELEKNNMKKCKFCKTNITSQNTADRSICSICIAYIPAKETTDSEYKTRPNIFKLCQNYLQSIRYNTARQMTETYKNDTEHAVEPKRCKLCKRHVDSQEEMTDSVCKICKAYFPISSHTNAGSKNVKIPILEHYPNQLQNEINKNSANIKVKCKLCKKFIESDVGHKRCFHCKRYINDSHQEKLEHICKICKANLLQSHVSTISSERTTYDSEITRLDSNASLCQYCTTNSVSSPIKLRKDKPMFIPTEIKCTGVSKCKGCTMGIKEFQTAVDKMIGLGSDLTPCTDCRIDRVGSAILNKKEICMGKSRCQVCRRYVDEWKETKGENSATYKNMIPICEFCRKHTTPLEKICSGKFKCKVGLSDKEEWKTVIEPKITLGNRIYMENQGKDINKEISSTKHTYVTKDCIEDIEIPIHMDTYNPDSKLIDQSKNSCRPRHFVELTKQTHASSEKNNICDCQKHESETKVCSRPPPLGKEIHPSILKLSAQVMNVPYENFTETFNQQIDDVNKATMKSTFSNDIIKRIKEAYMACSCKVCECITGKSLASSDVCNCKPCDCADCKSYKHSSHNAHSESKLACGCTPCNCIRCTQIQTKATAKSFSLPPVQTYITSRVPENRHADNCICPVCHCIECERNFFSLSTNATHDMSTEMMTSCRCEQYLDQRCNGAGGTDDCRCEMPSKEIFKPVEKDSHDYDIHRAAVYHQRNKRNDCHEATAMYATLSSNFSQLGTVDEGCSCEEYEYVSCKGENSKTSIKTLLKPQPASQMRYIKSIRCDCKACECENCSYARNIPDGHLINYKADDCNCDECDCMNCDIAPKSMTAKLSPNAKPIGKIYYRNNEKWFTDDNMLITGRKTILNENSCKNKKFDNTPLMKYNRYNYLDIKASTPARADSVSQDLAVQIPPTFNANKTFCDNLNKARMINCNTHDRSEINNCCSKVENSCSSIPTFADFNYRSFNENNEYGNEKIKLEPLQFTLSNYKADCAKSTLETCLNDILSLDNDFNLKMVSNMSKSNVANNSSAYVCEENQAIDDIDVYDYLFEPFSTFHHNFYITNLDTAQIYQPARNDNVNQSKICTKPSVVNYQNNFDQNQIDYARVYKTLTEAKDFSKQLTKLLEKYEKANKDFHSVSEQLKDSHNSSECHKLKDTVHFKLDYLVDDKQNDFHGDKELVKTKQDEHDGLSDIEISYCPTNYANRNKSNNAQIILLNCEQNDEEDYAYGHNKNSHFNVITKNLTTTETEIVNIDQRTFDYPLITTNDNLRQIPEDNTLNELIDDSSIQSKCDDNKVPKVEDNNQVSEKGENILKKFIKDTKQILPFEENTHNQVDILPDQVSEIITENVIQHYEETASCFVDKEDKTSKIPANNDYLIKEKNNESQGSLNRTNFHLSNLDFYIPPYGLKFFMDEVKTKTNATSVQTMLERKFNNNNEIQRFIYLKSGSSLPRNKTTQVDKESDTCVDYIKAKCSCEVLKVGFLGGRRVSDHTVMVKWSKPKALGNVQGYELLVDGRPVQTIIDSSRRMAVVTCLPNSDKVLLTMKTLLLAGTKSGHEPSVTIVYHPRLKKNKHKTEILK